MHRSYRSIVSVGLVVIAVMVLVSSFSIPIKAQTASTTFSTTVSTTSTTTMQSLSVFTWNSTSTSTTSTTALSTTSSIQVVTVTSVATVGSTTFQNPSSGGTGIPGFPLEAILLGIILGGLVIGLLRRRRVGKSN